MRKASRYVFGALLMAGLSWGQWVHAQSVTARLEVQPGTRLYVNQVATLTVIIESRGTSLSPGFSISGLPDRTEWVYGEFQELAPRRVREGESIVETHRFRSKIRVPKAGPLELALIVQGNAVQYQGSYGTIRIQRSFQATAPTVTLQVEDIPAADRPDAFDGAIGVFRLIAAASPTDVAPGDLVTVRSRIEGEGFLEGVQPPETLPDRHFRVYPPKAIETPEGAPPVYEQTLIPQNTNAVSVPPVTFTFFDPIARRYRTESVGPFALTFHERERQHVQRFQARPSDQEPLKALHDMAQSVENGRWSAATRQTAAQVAYWIVALSVMGMAATGRRSRRRWMAVGIILLLSIAFYAPYRQAAAHLAGGAAMVQVETDTTGRVAPGVKARGTFEITAGASVEIEESAGDWVRVAMGAKRGWIPAHALTKKE